MIYKALKQQYHLLRKKLADFETYRVVAQRLRSANYDVEFDYRRFKLEVLNFLETLKTDDSNIRFRYSAASSQQTLYSSVYACMTYSLLNEIDKLNHETRNSWVEYFDSFQSEKDGLFYDPVVKNEHYNDSDWWGARHLAVHMISAYTQLGSKPKYPFAFLEQYYDSSVLNSWLEKNIEMFNGDMGNDFDNRLMNITSLLQYQRDFWHDDEARKALNLIQEFLVKKVNPQTGIWGDPNIDDPVQRSRKVQFAYHLMPTFFYDDQDPFDFKKIIQVVLKTQNSFGGFGPVVNSSACDDIDSIDILTRASKFEKSFNSEITKSLEKGIKWIMLNQVSDGGFVFRLNESFTYGHSQLSSGKNQGAVFPTWFRTLSLAYLCRFLNIHSDFKIVRCPGYEF